jgi:cobalt-zinc-cadmium resistance protein CzcA
VVDTALTMSVIPMAVFGGILGLLITGIPFSVSAAIGFIALFGISVMDGIIIISQYNQLIDEGMERGRAILRTGELQLRPVLMTCVVAGIACCRRRYRRGSDRRCRSRWPWWWSPA